MPVLIILACVDQPLNFRHTVALFLKEIPDEIEYLLCIKQSATLL